MERSAATRACRPISSPPAMATALLEAAFLAGSLPVTFMYYYIGRAPRNLEAIKRKKCRSVLADLGRTTAPARRQRTGAGGVWDAAQAATESSISPRV